MIPVILETPYRAKNKEELARHKRYARACMLDCLRKNESPIASHLLYTQVLDDNDRVDRDLGIRAGFAWRMRAEMTVVYLDLGVTEGMQRGIDHAQKCNSTVEYRRLKNYLDAIEKQREFEAFAV